MDHRERPFQLDRRVLLHEGQIVIAVGVTNPRYVLANSVTMPISFARASLLRRFSSKSSSSPALADGDLHHPAVAEVDRGHELRGGPEALSLQDLGETLLVDRGGTVTVVVVGQTDEPDMDGLKWSRI